MDFINIAFYLVTLLANYFFPHGAKPGGLRVEARVPEVKMGRVDVTVANLAYTLRACA